MRELFTLDILNHCQRPAPLPIPPNNFDVSPTLQTSDLPLVSCDSPQSLEMGSFALDYHLVIDHDDAN